MIENPDVADVFSLWRTCGGVPGIASSTQLTRAAIDALAVVDAARAARSTE